METAAKQYVFEVVRRELMRIRREHLSAFDCEIRMESSLVSDLGFDSISMVEALVAVEDALQIDELSLAAWTDDELERDGRKFTVASLVDICLQRAPLRALAA